MSTLNRNTLIEELKEITRSALEKAKAYRRLSPEQLNYRPAEGRWSLLECLEHLNRYGDFYLPEIERRMLAAPKRVDGTVFKSGWLGNYFAGMMRLKEGKIKKMNTFKSMDPMGSELDVLVIDRFIKQQERMLQLLDQARKVDLTKTKTAISITKWIKLRLGDTFRVVVYHVERHVVQADRAMENRKVEA